MNSVTSKPNASECKQFALQVFWVTKRFLGIISLNIGSLALDITQHNKPGIEMENELVLVLKAIIPSAGFAGIVITFSYFLFRDFIRKKIFPELAKEQAYRLLALFLGLVFLLAVFGILINTSSDLSENYRLTIIIIAVFFLLFIMGGSAWLFYLMYPTKHRVSSKDNVVSQSQIVKPKNQQINKKQFQVENLPTLFENILKRYAIVDHERLIGVDELSKDVEKHLLAADRSWIISLFGEGGIGKTALAFEIVKQYAIQAGFTRLAWVSAKQRYYSLTGQIRYQEDVKLQWADLVRQAADQLHLEMGYSRTEWLDDFEKEIRQLSPAEKCLIVIDNLETVEDIGVIEYLDNPYNPRKGVIKPHKVIITTRKSIQAHSQNVFEIHLRGLKSNSTYELIRFLSRGNKDIEEADNEELKPIFEATEGNPLLIKLVVNRFLVSHKPLNIILKELKGIGPLRDFLYLQSLKELEQRFGGDVVKQLMMAFCPSIAGEALSFDQLFGYSGISNERIFGDVLKLACDLSLIRVSGLDAKYSIHSLLWEFICREE